jgi:hypothetical protein
VLHFAFEAAKHKQVQEFRRTPAFDTASGERSSGYRFQILGDPLSDQFVLLGQLIAKMRRLLAVVHIRDRDLGLQIAN